MSTLPSSSIYITNQREESREDRPLSQGQLHQAGVARPQQQAAVLVIVRAGSKTAVAVALVAPVAAA